MPNRKLALIVCLVLSLVLFSAGCKKKPPTADAQDASADQPSIQTPEPTPRPTPPPVEVEGFDQQDPQVGAMDETAQVLNDQEVLKTIYFAFDQDELTDTARAILRENANWMKANPVWNVVIQGHCDERGTIEYNLALGQRRANTVRAYLTNLGVNSSRVRTVSYGEERPASPGHTEAAWAKNRRGVSQVEER